MGNQPDHICNTECARYFRKNEKRLNTIIYKGFVVWFHLTYLLLSVCVVGTDYFTLSFSFSFSSVSPTSGRGGRLGVRLWPLLSVGGPSSQGRAGLLSGFGRLALRAAGLVGWISRVNNNRKRVRGAVFCLSHGACTNLFGNFREKILIKRDISNNTTLNPPLSFLNVQYL